jgi:hypothetical protein
MLPAENFIVMIEGEATACDLDISFRIKNVRQRIKSFKEAEQIFFEVIHTGPNNYLNAS